MIFVLFDGKVCVSAETVSAHSRLLVENYFVFAFHLHSPLVLEVLLSQQLDFHFYPSLVLQKLLR